MSYIDNIVKFHTFSKSTVRENLTLGEAVNPSGHTVTAKQIRTQDIPAFIYSFQNTEADALSWAAGNINDVVRHNDILYYGSDFKMGFGAPKCLIRVAKTKVDGKLIDLPKEQHGWIPFNIQEVTQLANSNGDNVINIHKNCKIAYVHTDNNAAVNSNKFAAFIKAADGRILDHFIAATDQIIGGQPSLGYTLLLFKDGQTKALLENEETGKDNYIANPFAGIIHFMDERTESYDAAKNYEVSGFSVYCYEYIGDKLDGTLTESTVELKNYVDAEINKAIEYRTVNIINGTDNIEIEYKDTVDGDGNPGTYTISVDGYTKSEINDIKNNINDVLDEHTTNSTIHVTSNDKLRWNEAEELLNEHINDDDKHVTEEDRERWDKGGSAIQSISQGDYINISETNTISVTNVTSNIAESENSSLTTAASVREYVKDINDNIETHLEDNERHITADERDKWNKNISSTYSIKTLVPNKYSVDGAGRSGAFTTFILPNNFYPANVQFNAIKIDTLNINGTTPTEAYLGVMALYSDGTKKALSISDNTNLSGTKGSPVWYFSTPFTIEENYRLIFYILKDKESFIESEPTVDKNIAIGAVVYNTNVLDPYENWNEAQTNLNFGFIVNGPYQQNNAYPSWPACTLYKLNHVNNQDIHITDSERTKWNSALYTISEGDYIDISDDSNTISVTNIAESISDSNSNSLVTEGTLIKYADDTKDENGNITEEGLLTRWHIENEYFHMKKSVADSLKSFNLDNYGIGDECKGVIMNLPYLSKIKSISLVAVTASSYNQPIASKAMTWNNYRLKIVDILTGKVLATSEIGKNANTSLNTSEKGYPIGVFDFDKQIYCDANRDYYILFVNKADETANIELAYANGNGSYATYENYTFGELSPKVILSDGTIKEHPPTFSVASQDAVSCKGYACDFAVDTVKSEELTHLSEEIAELRRYFISMSTYLSQLSKLQ